MIVYSGRSMGDGGGGGRGLVAVADINQKLNYRVYACGIADGGAG